MPRTDSPDALAMLLWVFWGGLIAVTIGEVVLFVFSGGSTSTTAPSAPPLPQIAVTASIASVLFGLSIAAHYFRIGGGGLPTGLMSWVLAKSVAITGLVFYKVAGDVDWLWPFVVAFAVAMVVTRPPTLLKDDDETAG